MEREIIWKDRDNSIDVLLKSNDVAYDLSGTTHMALVFSGVTFSSVGRSSWFNWTSGTTGKLSLSFGGVTVAPGFYQARLIIYDSGSTNGICWGEIPVVVKS